LEQNRREFMHETTERGEHVFHDFFGLRYTQERHHHVEQFLHENVVTVILLNMKLKENYIKSQSREFRLLV